MSEIMSHVCYVCYIGCGCYIAKILLRHLAVARVVHLHYHCNVNNLYLDKIYN